MVKEYMDTTSLKDILANYVSRASRMSVSSDFMILLIEFYLSIVGKLSWKYFHCCGIYNSKTELESI